MKYITTDDELNLYVNEMIAFMISDISNAILAQLYDNIMKNTYELGGDNKIYFNGTGQPTRDFLYAFHWEEMKKGVTSITRELVYDWGSMRLLDSNDNYPAHKSFDGTDMREELAELLDFNGTIACKERKEFWEPTLDWVEKNIDILVVKCGKKYGLYLDPE